MTPAQQRALEIVQAHPGIMPREFAQLMWPDSEGWSHHTNCGPKGVTRGGGMNLAGGGYLGKLQKKGWVTLDLAYRLHGNSYPGYVITTAGRDMLKEEK